MGYDSETAKNSEKIRLSNAVSLSRSSQIEDTCNQNAVDVGALPNSVTDSKYNEEKASLESESKGNGEATSAYNGTEPVEACLLYTQDEEASVIRVFDRRLVLFIALLYMLSFLDRSSTLSLRL